MRYNLNEGPVNTTNSFSNNGELSRLITAAVVNQRFCDLLLADPRLALAGGYQGEVFHLTLEEYRLVVSVRANSLADFATQLAEKLKGNGHGSSPNGNGRNGFTNGTSE